MLQRKILSCCARGSGGPNISVKTKQKIEDMKKIISRKHGNNDRLNNSDESDDDLPNYDTESSLLKRVKDGEFDIKDICVSCDKLDAKVIMQHPVMEGGLCEECKNHLMETLFTLGEDGLYTNCVLCALSESLVICDNNECFRSFCTECVEMLVSKEALEKVLGENPWHCYFCVPYVKEKFGLIQIKNNWKLNVLSLYEPQRRPGLDYFGFVKDKKPITVLSLFDGIGTGRLILDKLGFDVAKYYAFEIDENAMNISKIKLPNKITYMGDIREFENKQIKQIGPIDLVIAGSPCNDLSLVNPNRKGLFSMEGSGYFFFYFFKVLKAVEIENSQTGHPFFWLFENVSHMKTSTKGEIGRFLECDPVLVNAIHFSPQHRARYFWGNIPGLYSTIPSHILESNITLDSALTPNLNRVATVKKIRTVTTNGNSLKQGVPGKLPVKMNGKSDNIWITELEKVFGFEKHYTDTGNLNVAQRQQLLGRAWSVQVVQYLLTPLKNYYKLKTSVNIETEI